MIDLVITYDSVDAKLSKYFIECYNKLINNIELNNIEPSINLTPITGKPCNEIYLDHILTRYKPNRKFFFVAFSHGEETTGKSLLNEGSPYVTSHSTHLFENSFFYSNACSIGLTLGNDLIKSGCLTFIGCNKPVDVILREDILHLNARCDVYLPIMFLNSDKSAKECLEATKNEFTNIIDKLYGAKENPFILAALVMNRDAFILLGDANLRCSDLI